MEKKVVTVKSVSTTPLLLFPARVNATELSLIFLALMVCALVDVVYAVPLSMVKLRPVSWPLLANVKLYSVMA